LSIKPLKPVIVIGLGNPLMTDEGIGTAMVEGLAALAADGKLPSENVDYLDGGCGGMYLLHSIAERKKVILIDCAKMGLEPGAICRFTPDEVNTVKQMTHLSLHEVDILRVIELAKLLDQCPDEIVIFGIQPAAIAPRIGLTASIEARLPEYVAAISREIETCQ
jgi:hydrogenase maturation protease